MIKVGDKLVATKTIGFLQKDTIVDVVDVNGNDIISFTFGDGMHQGVMNTAECEKYFTKLETETKAPSITVDYIKDILANSTYDIKKVFDKCTIVACRLPNGFVIVESAACVHPENYNEAIGVDICMDKIEDKLWELEGYRLQAELHENGMPDYSDNNCGDCGNCPCGGLFCEDEDEDEIEVEVEPFDTDDMDCDSCEARDDCPFNN